jgi:cytosine permease
MVQWGIPSINSLLVAGIVYYAGMKVFGASLDQKWNVKMDKAG